MTDEEIKLLEKMKSGALDGFVGDIISEFGGPTVWTAIDNGIPTRYKRGPGGQFFNGKENKWYEDGLQIIRKWETDDEKLEFLQRFGWLMDYEDARAYSVKSQSKKQQ